MATNRVTRTATEEGYYSALSAQHAVPFWTKANEINPPRPTPVGQVQCWRYAEMRPSLMEAGRIVGAEEAERRVLMLKNPSMRAPYTTDTIYAGLQMVLPGETAPAHRHIAFALRFIIEGKSGFTAVEGERVPMERGDVILTPTWTWHDHGNEGTEPMIWMDGLDLPLFEMIRVNYGEAFAEKRYPSQPATGSDLRFPWADVRKALDASTDKFAIHHYRKRSGEYISKSVGAQAQQIPASSTTPWSRETFSFVFHVYEGCGYTDLVLADGRTKKRVDWEVGDVFAVPAWTAIRHTSTQPVGCSYLFAVNDRPLIEAFGLYRSEQPEKQPKG